MHLKRKTWAAATHASGRQAHVSSVMAAQTDTLRLSVTWYMEYYNVHEIQGEPVYTHMSRA